MKRKCFHTMKRQWHHGDTQGCSSLCRCTWTRSLQTEFQPVGKMFIMCMYVDSSPRLTFPGRQLKHFFFSWPYPRRVFQCFRLRDTSGMGFQINWFYIAFLHLSSWSSLHLLLHLIDFNCLLRSRLAERETWLDSSRWGSPCSCE